MKFTKIPEETFKKLQLNAGVLLRSFDPATATVDDTAILGATSGGTNFSAVPSFLDFGEDIDNCPKNMKELKRLDIWDVNMSGTFITIDVPTAKDLIAAADISDEGVITPRNDLADEDFIDLWWVGDYSDENGGFVAIHMINALSTGGFSIQSGDKAKGQYSYTFTAHYSIEDQTKVPFEVYIKAGTAA